MHLDLVTVLQPDNKELRFLESASPYIRVESLPPYGLQAPAESEQGSQFELEHFPNR